MSTIHEYIPAQLPNCRVAIHQEKAYYHAILTRIKGGVLWQWRGENRKAMYKAVNEAVEAQAAIERSAI